MKRTEKIEYYDDSIENNRTIEVETVSCCPHCGYSIKPETNLVDRKPSFAWLLHQCPNCDKFFLSEYTITDSFSYDLVKTYPTFIPRVEVPDKVETVSPRFKKIYQQASTCESMSLDEIVGMGYRKALEILVIDYLLSIGYTEDDFKEKTIHLNKNPSVN